MSTLKGITEALKASKSLQQVKKGASAVKAFGKTAYGEAKGAFDVGKEYLKTQKTRFAGTDLGKQLGVIKTGTADRYQKLPDWMKQELRSAAIFAGAEQILPRVMGQKPQASIPESIVRQLGAATVAMPVSAGLRGIGLPPDMASITGQYIGQPLGHQIADTLLPGNQVHPFADPTGAVRISREPESAEIRRPTTADLMGKQEMDAMRTRYNYRLALAEAEGRDRHSFVHHESPVGMAQAANDIAARALREGYSAKY